MTNNYDRVFYVTNFVLFYLLQFYDILTLNKISHIGKLIFLSTIDTSEGRINRGLINNFFELNEISDRIMSVPTAPPNLGPIRG